MTEKTYIATVSIGNEWVTSRPFPTVEEALNWAKLIDRSSEELCTVVHEKIRYYTVVKEENE